MNDVVQIPTHSINPNDYQIIEELQGRKIYKPNQRTIVSINNVLRSDGTAEIFGGTSATLNIVSLFVEGHGHKISRLPTPVSMTTKPTTVQKPRSRSGFLQENHGPHPPES